MIIRRIRLKNIKSFGEGPAGDGVTVEFDRGINRIGGKNGTGKSSIIESIGYALFDAEPERGDNRFRVESYLVRTGQKAGEIDVWVETGDGVYRVERDIGATKRRWKVVREDDGFIEAEGEKEVPAFLAMLWGLPGPDRLGELFHGLIGVKQGRFTQPFDCAPSFARGHFDPLLDVDIFRKCFDYLLAPLRMLAEQKHQSENQIKWFEGQMVSLSDAAAKAAAAEATLRDTQAEMELAAGRLAVAQLELAHHEEASLAKNLAGQELALAGQAQRTAAESLESTRLEHGEAIIAAEKTGASEAGFHAYRRAEESYKKYEGERTLRDLLVKEINERSIKQSELNQDKKSEEKSRNEYIEFAGVKQREVEGRSVVLAEQRSAFEALKTSAEQNVDRAQRARAAVERIARWHHGLTVVQGQMEQELRQLESLQKELAGFDGDGLARAETAWTTAQKEAEAIRVALARSEQAVEHLTGQLASIRGGVCPFLGEPCRQFNEEAIQDQLEELGRENEGWSVKLASAETMVRRSEEVLTEQRQQEKVYAAKKQLMAKCLETIAMLWQQTDDPEAARYAETMADRWPGEPWTTLHKMGEEQDSDWQNAYDALVGFTRQLGINLGIWQEKAGILLRDSQELSEQAAKEKALIEQMKNELNRLTQEAQKFLQMAEESGQKIFLMEKSLAEHGEKLVVLNQAAVQYRDLDQTMETMRQEMEANRQNFADYIRYQPLAAKLTEIQSRLEKASVNDDQARQRLQEAEKNLVVRTEAYKENLHAEAKEAFQRQLQFNGQIENLYKQAQQESDDQKERCRIYEELSVKRREAFRELDGIISQSIMLEKARTVLKNAQTMVAQGLTRRIQSRAQTIFNAMSREPVQFEWDAGEYKLTVHTTAGPRRFTQLSGGQQMKVAIAMQLALVKEFSSAGFCAFDEPTYGLDSESRSLLAEAIVQAQNECRFEQLFVVSHDEAFDDKVEHIIQLGYSSKNGTEAG